VEVVAEDQVLVVGVSEEESFRCCLELVVKEFVSISIRELDYWVFQVPDAFEHLIRN